MPAAAGKDYAARGARAMTLAADSERRATESRQDKVAFWNDPRVRSFAVQAALIAAVIFFAYEITHNTYVNLKSRNIASGYGFLGKTAGFDITDALVSYSSNSTYWDALVVGFLNTIRVSLLGIMLATIIGFVMGVARLSRNWLVAKIGTLYVEIFRNVPLLLWMFIIYGAMLQPLPGPKQAINILDSFFLSNRGLMVPKPSFEQDAWLGLAGFAVAIAAVLAIRRLAKARQEKSGEVFPIFWTGAVLVVGLPFVGFALAGFPIIWSYPELKGFNFAGGSTLYPEFIALLVAISVYTGTFIAEAVRAGILAVSHGQTEAALALGLRRPRALRLIIIPQAMRVIIPPLASTYLSLTKNSSLAVAIGYPDLVSVGGTSLNQTGQAIEIVLVWMVVYLTLSLLTSAFMNWFNARMKLVER